MKIQIQGREVEVEKVGFRILSEPWAEFTLEDGTLLKCKMVLTQVFKKTERVEGELPYHMNCQIINVIEDLKG